jgi:uncharacterized protein (DUF1501 family)
MNRKNRSMNACPACQSSRRDFLKRVAAAGLAAGLGVVPIDRWASAQQGGAPAKRTLILNLTGGVRSSAVFHASADTALNPWGLYPGTGGLRLGAALSDAISDPRLSPTGQAEVPVGDGAYTPEGWDGLRMPRIHEFADRFSVLGTWNEGRGDHVKSQIEESTGGSRADPGLLTRVNMALSSASEPDVPPFAVNGSVGVFFSGAPGATVQHAPVEIATPYELPGNALTPGPVLDRVGGRWNRDDTMHARLDQARLARTRGQARILAQGHAATRRNHRKLGVQLGQAWVAPGNPDAAYGNVHLGERTAPLTNGMLASAFGAPLLDPAVAPYRDDYQQDAANLAFAVRLLQLGAPTVVVELGQFDLHAEERQRGPSRYRTLARFWSTLGWVLGRMEEPSDASQTMLDNTLVMTTSEFGRDPGNATTGFNDGDGTDHGNHASCFYLGHAVMGAGIQGGRIIGGVGTDGASAFDARRADASYGTRDLMATVLYALGLDHKSDAWGFPFGADPIRELWGT